MKIRLAEPRDAAEITNVHINSWRETYTGLLPQKFIDELPLSFRRRHNYWTDSLAKNTAFPKVFVAEHEKFGVIGFSSVCEARDEDLKESGELACIYLLKAFQGQKIGRQLLKAAFAYLAEQGFTSAYCWVLDTNPAVQFYENNGATLLERQKTDVIGGESVIELAFFWNKLK